MNICKPPSLPQRSENTSEVELTTNIYPSFGATANNDTREYLEEIQRKDFDSHNARVNTSNIKDKKNSNSRHGSSYKGWKLTIPAPSFYSIHKYDSQCIEICGGKSTIDDNSNSQDNNVNADEDMSIPFIKLPSLKISTVKFQKKAAAVSSAADSSVSSESVTEEISLLRSPSPPTGIDSNIKNTTIARPTAWTYAAPHLTNWKISSNTLLTVTYKKSIHCIPEYTNRNICLDYVSRMVNVGTSSCRSDNNPTDTEVNNNMALSEASSENAKTIAKMPIFKECYTEEDIMDIQAFDKIQVTGFTGFCKAIQIRLKPKHSGANRRFNYATSTSKEQKLGKKLQQYIDRSHLKNTVPDDGDIILKEHEYGIENDYGLPLPPWDPRYVENSDYVGNRSPMKGNIGDRYDVYHDIDDINGYDTEESEDSLVHGPIVTFAIPSIADKNQMDPATKESSESDNVIRDSVPLLWKVNFPPDPSIAVEAFTVLDGVLNVNPEPSMSNTNVDNDDKSRASSCSTCSNDGVSYPTNIYINGYQSWSFAGSVKKGETQPTSAMPDFLSKAFNYGADVPPAANVNVTSRPRRYDQFDGAYIKNNAGDATTKSTRDIYDQSTPHILDYSHDDDYYSFHEATHYRSDFYTCVSTSDIETMQTQGVGSGRFDSYKKSFNKKSHRQLDEMGGTALVLGFLAQRKQFSLITFDSDLERVAMHASLQGVIASRSIGISTDWAYCQILPAHVYDEEPMAHYLNAVSSYNNAKPLQKHPPLTGWCSWYHYYENIDLITLNDNFKKMSGLKKVISQDLAIIDDGYITAWGDWASLKKKGFPERSGGMKALADNIQSNNMIPGLWMAPFACDKHSQIAKEHPDWIIRNREGRIANSANCGKFFYGLDATNPAVREFAFKSVQRAVKEWGYRCLKLDFLYAACLDGNGKYDLSMSRAETMYLAIQTLRAAAGPDTFLIGCGCPLAPAIGYMDSMRISADTGPTWYPEFPLPWWDHATLPSLRAMIRNSTTRACLGHRWWHNDPDCVLLGETTSLSDNEVASAASIVGMKGGMLLLSDDLSQLTNERIAVATKIFPVTGITAVALDLHITSVSGLPSLLRLWCTDSVQSRTLSPSDNDLASKNARHAAFSPSKPWKNPASRERNCVPVAKGLGTWSVVSLSNWFDKSNIVSVPIISLLPPTTLSDHSYDLGCHVFAFWSSKYIWISSDKLYGHKTISKRLGPRETEIFHVKPVHPTLPQYIGSDLHFTCGYEVKKLVLTATSITVELKNNSKRLGYVYLYIPTFGAMINVMMNGIMVRAEVVARTPQVHKGNVSYGGQVIRVYTVMSGNSNDGTIICNF